MVRAEGQTAGGSTVRPVREVAPRASTRRPSEPATTTSGLTPGWAACRQATSSCPPSRKARRPMSSWTRMPEGGGRGAADVGPTLDSVGAVCHGECADGLDRRHPPIRWLGSRRELPGLRSLQLRRRRGPRRAPTARRGMRASHRRRRPRSQRPPLSATRTASPTRYASPASTPIWAWGASFSSPTPGIQTPMGPSGALPHADAQPRWRCSTWALILLRASRSSPSAPSGSAATSGCRVGRRSNRRSLRWAR